MTKKRETAAERRDRLATTAKRVEAERLAEAGKVFMEYHEDSAWAAHKLASGTAPLTPESVMFMQQEIASRKAHKAHMDKIKAELDAEKPPANPIGGTK